MTTVWNQTARYLALCLRGEGQDDALHPLAQAAGISVGSRLYRRHEIYTALGQETRSDVEPLEQADADCACALLTQAAEDCRTAADRMKYAQALTPYAVGADRAAHCISLWDCWRMLTAIARASKGNIEEKSMLLCALDFSGIQSYIYTISASQRVNTNIMDILRSRSTSLGILMEEIVAEFMQSIGLDEGNIIYSGGGDAYLLLHNDEETVQALRQAAAHVNEWLIAQTGTALYLSYGAAACAPGDFSDPEAYRALFRTLTERIARTKLNRYTPAQIQTLNRRHGAYRECAICHRPAEDGKALCASCAELIAFSDVLTGSRQTVSVRSAPPASGAYLTIPSIRGGSRYVVPDPAGEKTCGGLYAAKQKTLDALAYASVGIERIGVLRADVDNLGQTFISGFAALTEQGSVNLLLLTAILSRALTEYFSVRLEQLLKKTDCNSMTLPGSGRKDAHSRIVTTIYAGGDDVFLIGAWDELLCAACDMARDFYEYTGGKLSVSAGIGMYQANYPVFGFAHETGDMESAAKEIADGTKNALALFEESTVVHWQDFSEQIVRKMEVLNAYFRFTLDDNNQGGGTSFLFNLKTLIDEMLDQPDKKIDLARFAYLLARMEPKKKNDNPEQEKEIMDAYRKFRDNLYNWMVDKDQTGQRKHLQTAVNLYLYLKRKKRGGGKHGKN